MATRKKASEKVRAPAKKRWSQRVTKESDALDLERGVFTKGSAEAIAASLKRSAEHPKRRQSEPYRSAMSMLVFYINRAGKDLPAAQRKKLEATKCELGVWSITDRLAPQ